MSARESESSLRRRLAWLAFFAPLAAFAVNSPGPAQLRFEVALSPGLTVPYKDGRLFVVLARTNKPDPCLTLGRAGLNAPEALAQDVTGFGTNTARVLDETAFAWPVTNLAAMPAGDYFAQALFECNPDLRTPFAPGNIYSAPQKIHFDAAQGGAWKLKLDQQVPPERLPTDTEQVRFIKLQSTLLSRFYGRPIYLRAGVVLPRNYDHEPERRYPLWVRIGGLDTRYSIVGEQMREGAEFRKVWMAQDTPRLILLQLDGAGPNGDPYYVNSANNGPFGDALTQELIPYVEGRFRAVGQPRARFLSGVSTGGWVCLALQVFYPDFFNGAWSSCPDPVDFRALELVNIYQDDNAYVNRYGFERPSERDRTGDVRLTMRREVGAENLLGRGNSYTLSGEQWGDWNAVFGPRGTDGLPVPIWDPQSGEINHAVAEQWKKYDLRLVLEQNWQTLGPKLRGKLHIAAGEADDYFLNNAVHLLEASLTKADPPFVGHIAYGPGKGHGWSDITVRQMLEEMQATAAEK
ncbi:MAG TPA: alpha/beta hydrolase-fold protein [Candidatus Acidoferrum sp.]|nr:alpha/beta hydrolase-fold protein [Candidatus Acidoferrum sp.]